ncbi:glycosyltransferase family 4 protein [Chelatococcus daeguensis]|uniref:glycosyltransferase family 4 protein n=1 Tax=Chelatococcus daeguensis TaxID=444444 RepID=UPI0007ABE9CB|nr:glycosyltransferase family 4 protein [Chelatococcus daeguensis]KZE29179.1 glycosyl transferase [Chelatococcus daeguensis]MBM3083892.1 glycosyltransferase family 4 protein [Chelatococcus daeguensis]
MKVLVVAHNHPDFHPGGTEIFAHDLFLSLKERGLEALFLAATNRIHRDPRPGTAFQGLPGASDEVVLWSGHFDRFYMSQTDTYGVVPDLKGLIESFRPDVVHIHHLLLVGVEFIALVRRLLPETRIVVTLHDYYPICAHDGLMMRTKERERCDAASPHRCHGCFPEIGADRFLLRERHLKTHFSQVDLFIAPSRFLKERYVAWGLPSGAIEVVANGRPAVPAAAHRSSPDGRRPVFGYFGNFNPWKGVTVLLKAAARLADLDGFALRLHGGAPFQAEHFVAEVDELAAAVEPHVVRLGPYRRDELPALMAAVDWVVMPSIWWENAPLVIQEAFRHRRPVIASGIGGMAEMVRDGVDGLLVRPDDPSALASAIREAAETQGLWDRLVGGIAAPPDIGEVADRHIALYSRAGRMADAA